MNARERFAAIMAFDKADRGLLWEMGYWVETLERWYGEGLERRRGLHKEFVAGEGVRGESVPHDVTSTVKARDADVHEQLGLDPALVSLPINSGFLPPFPVVVVDETDDTPRRAGRVRSPQDLQQEDRLCAGVSRLSCRLPRRLRASQGRAVSARPRREGPRRLAGPRGRVQGARLSRWR